MEPYLHILIRTSTQFMPQRIKTLTLIFALLLCCAGKSHAYSVLTHQALIDAAWDSALKPLLKTKYPASTEEQLREAHAYAYGGAIAPDMGYYPFGSVLFTN